MTTELAWSWLRYQPESALSGWFRERFGGGGKRWRRIGIVAVARKLLIALWRFLKTGVFPEGAVLQRSVSRIEVLSQASALGLVEVARCFSGPCKAAVGEMGSPPTGLPTLVERRREHRVTGVSTRTDRRSLETRGLNATGSRQTDRGHVTQRSKNGGEKKYTRGLDNSGNIEGKTHGIFASPSPWPACAGSRYPRAARRGAAMRRLDRRWRRRDVEGQGFPGARASERVVGQSWGGPHLPARTCADASPSRSQG